MNKLVCLGLLLLVAYSTATKYKDCGSADGVVSSMEVSGCPDTVSPCPLVRGQDAEITINFKSNVDTTKVKTVVHGIIKGVPLPFPIQPDACKGGVTCPLKNGQSYTYKNSFPVKSAYPSVYVTVRYELKDDARKDIVCVEIESEIK